MNKKIKKKKCRVCKKSFKPRTSLQIVCDFRCALKLNEIKKEKKTKQEERKHKKEKLDHKKQDRPHQFNLTKKAVQQWVNHIRDKKYYCISCPTTNNVLYSGGHYKTAGGHPERALWSPNIHKQCLFYCNKNLSGNIEGNKTSHGYREGVIKRYGKEYLDHIEVHREFKMLSCEDLIWIRKEYRKLIRNNDSDDRYIIDFIEK